MNMMLEYMKIVKGKHEVELQFSNKFSYSIVNNEIRRVNKSFDSSKLYEDIFYNVTAFVGANGSGKTSLIYKINNILSNHYKEAHNEKYIIILKSEKNNTYYYKSHNILIENSGELQKLEGVDLDNNWTRAIYTNVVDGNDLFAKSDKKLIDLSLNYELFKEKSSSKSVKSKLTFNQLLLISQYPELLTKNGLSDLSHPKEVIFEPNLDYLNSTEYQKLFDKYLVYIKTDRDSNIYNDFDIEYSSKDLKKIIKLMDTKLNIVDGKTLIMLKDFSGKISYIKLYFFDLQNILNLYNMIVINDVKNYFQELKLNFVFEKKEFLNLISTYFLEELFVKYFKNLIDEIDLKGILGEKLLDDTFYLDLDNLIDNLFDFLKYLDNLIDIFNSISNSGDDLERFGYFYYEDLEDEKDEFLKAITNGLNSKFRDSLVKEVYVNTKLDKIVSFKWETCTGDFYKYITENIRMLIADSIIIETLPYEDYIVDLESNSSSEKTLYIQIWNLTLKKLKFQIR